MKQTAVEWLADKMLTESHSKIEWDRIVEQAKEMEKEQIVNAYNDCEWTGDHEDGEKYYKETYESKTD